MIVDRRAAERLRQLLGIVERELSRLQSTDRRLFKQPFTAERASSLNEDEDLAERVEAFVSRFGRLQDTLGDKVFPTYLAAQGEKAGAFGDNLDRAERLGLVQDAQSWIDMRRLRNQMVHEYIEDPVVLASALQAGHEFVGRLEQAVSAIRHLLPAQ